MPKRAPVVPYFLPETEKDRQLVNLKAENKSLRRQITSLRRAIHKLHTNSKNGVLDMDSCRCPKCAGVAITVRMPAYKDAHKCKACGYLWLTAPEKSNVQKESR